MTGKKLHEGEDDFSSLKGEAHERPKELANENSWQVLLVSLAGLTAGALLNVAFGSQLWCTEGLLGGLLAGLLIRFLS
jgi:hypothetical protein